MSSNLPELVKDLPITLRPGPGNDSAHKDADLGTLEHYKQGEILARKYKDLSLRLSWIQTPVGKDFSAEFTFSVYADGWCTVDLNKGFGYELRDGNGVILRRDPERMPEMQQPRKWYFVSRSFAINQDVFDRAEIFRFIAAEDKVVSC